VRAACRLIAGAGGPVIAVAIDGAGGAGKSTLADAICAALRGAVQAIAIVRVDDFYRPLHEDVRVALDAEHGYRNYFDWIRLRDRALIPLRAGKIASYRRYDWSTGELGDRVTVKPAPVVLIEGVYSSRPELRPLLDLAIFVDAPRDLRMRRMSARGQNASEWIARWMAAEDWYLEHVRPADHADLVVRGF